ncbi:MAG: type II toxin-antitoxin system RelE/ParE family toxin [Acidobacteria bacterium]|nr:type II toxin-antitoxin system RelE/ParE family toxin [Acidobacteriota bacterium]
MARIVWTEPALEDLNEIAEYIALDNLTAAKKLVAGVFESVGRLSKHPESGRIPEELSGSVYRELIYPPCRVFYRIDNKTVYIIYVMRSEQMLRKYMIDERKI